MSYTEDDYAADQYFLQISKELYPEHKAQAIAEFTRESLHSFYVQNPLVMRPAVQALQEGVELRGAGHHAAAVVFFVSAIELFLKATILKPVVYGLVNHSGLADIVVDHATGSSGFKRYNQLLSKLYSELAGINLQSISRPASKLNLLAECGQLQDLRSAIIHKGQSCAPGDSESASQNRPRCLRPDRAPHDGKTRANC